MSPRLKSLLSVGASLLLAGGLLALALRGADLGAIGTALVEGEWIWLVPFVAVAWLSVVVRAWRWGLLLDALPEGRRQSGLRLLTASVLIGYLVNYAAPRLGEVARTANVSRRGGVPFTAVLGTVVAERVLDVLALGATLLGVAVLYGDRLGAIWAEASAGLAAQIERAPVELLGVVALVILAGAAGAVWMARRLGVGERLASLAGTFRDGVLTAVRTGRLGALLGSTVVLWACYALMADFPLRLLGIAQASGLGHLDAWAVMAIGGIGMALPAPGGTGSFHYATVQALTLLFAVGVTPAATYAILVHAAGIVFYAITGGLALVMQGASVRSLTREARA
ncbi:MAG: lysylphosphatidylglycerol synthase transmembrane domain-containing protein [Bacteroidota bacterium]